MKAGLTNSTVESPLAWFEALVISEGIGVLHVDFKAKAAEQDGYFMPLDQYGKYYDESVYFVDTESNAQMLLHGYTFESYCENRVSYEYGLAVLNLDKKLLEIEEEKAFQKYTIQILTLINSLVEIAQKKKGFKDKSYLHKVLNDLKEYIEAKTNRQISVISKEDEKVSNKNKFGYFGSINIIHHLFSTLVEIGLVEDEGNQRQLFYDILSNPEESAKGKLKVVCKNGEAAYIFQELKILFNGLTPSNIEKSKLFINKKGAIITANDLSKALTIYNKKYPNPSKEEIDEMIAGLVKS